MEGIVKVEVQVNPEIIQSFVDQKISDFLIPTLRMVDSKVLQKMYGMSPNELEEILMEPKVKIHERRKGERGKRRWFFPEVQQAIDEVINEKM